MIHRHKTDWKTLHVNQAACLANCSSCRFGGFTALGKYEYLIATYTTRRRLQASQRRRDAFVVAACRAAVDSTAWKQVLAVGTSASAAAAVNEHPGRPCVLPRRNNERFVVNRYDRTQPRPVCEIIYCYKKPTFRWDSRSYCLTADYLVISDCC